MKKIETLQDSIRAAMAADELPITKLALKNGSGSRESRNAAWFRVVRATNRERPPGAWQFLGQYAKDEIEEPPGSIVLGKSMKGEYQLMLVMPGVGLRTLTVASSATIEMRRRTQSIINDPATAIETEISRAMEEAEEAQRLLNLDKEEKPAKGAKNTPKSQWTERDTRNRECRRQIADFQAIMDALPFEPPSGAQELRAEHRRLRLRLKEIEEAMADR